MIRLEDIDGGNWRTPLRVSKEQEQYVANSTTILARAYAYRNTRSQALLIYEDDTPVGMAMYHDEDSMGAYIFSEIFIDERFQGKGYGRAATKLVIVLEADYQTIHDRILARGEEEGCWCMENIELAREGSAALPGIHIQTDDKTVDELCDEVLIQTR